MLCELNLKDHKYVIIMQGPQYSGKSTLAGKIKTVAGQGMCEVVSADDHFTTINADGMASYKFVGSELPAAHHECFSHFCKAIVDGKRLIVVDNTNADYLNYVRTARLATRAAYKIIVIQLVCENVQLLIQRGWRSLHSVPDFAIERTIKSIQEPKLEDSGVVKITGFLGEDIAVNSKKPRFVTLTSNPIPRLAKMKEQGF